MPGRFFSKNKHLRPKIHQTAEPQKNNKTSKQRIVCISTRQNYEIYRKASTKTKLPNGKQDWPPKQPTAEGINQHPSFFFLGYPHLLGLCASWSLWLLWTWPSSIQAVSGEDSLCVLLGLCEPPIQPTQRALARRSETERQHQKNHICRPKR